MAFVIMLDTPAVGGASAARARLPRKRRTVTEAWDLVAWQASAMMIVGQMVAKTLLGPAVVDELLEALCKGAHSSLRLQALRLLLLTCRTHSLAQLPKSALAFVVKVGQATGRRWGGCWGCCLSGGERDDSFVLWLS